MKEQALFSSKDRSKKKMLSAAIFVLPFTVLGALL